MNNLCSGSFGYPSGVAVDGSGNVFVADNAQQTIYEIPAGNCSSLKTLGGSTSSFGATNLGGIAVDGSGNLFFTNFSGSKGVYEVTKAGGYSSATLLSSSFSAPKGIAVDASGNIFVADNGNGNAYEMVATGGVVTS